MKRRKRSFLRDEKGAALVGVLMVLLVLTLWVGSAFLSSLTEISIASNHEAGLEAAYAAEAGLQDLLSLYRSRPEWFLEGKPQADLGFPLFDPATATCRGASYCLEHLSYEPASPPAFALAVMVGEGKGGKGLSRIKGMIQGQALGGPFPVPEIFRMGLVTAGRLEICDPLSVQGDLHGGRGVSITPFSVGQQLLQNRFSVTQGMESLRPDFQRMPDIPRITESRFQDYLAAAASPHQRFSGSQSLTLKGDQEGKIFYIDGDLLLKAEDLSRVVIVVKGNLTVAGNTLFDSEKTLDTAFISGGGVVVHPQGELNGVFWTNGSFLAAGPGKIRGAVVAQGDLRLGTGIGFERETRIAQAFLSPLAPAVTFHLAGWSQQ